MLADHLLTNCRVCWLTKLEDNNVKNKGAEKRKLRFWEKEERGWRYRREVGLKRRERVRAMR